MCSVGCSSNDTQRNAPLPTPPLMRASSPADALALVRASGAFANVGRAAAVTSEGVATSVHTIPTFEARVPMRARGRLELRGRVDGARVAIREDARRDVAGTLVEGAVVYPGALPEVDIVQALGPLSTEEFRILRSAAAPSRARYLVELGPGLVDLRTDGERAFAVDAQGFAHLQTHDAFAIDARGTRRALIWSVSGSGKLRQLDLSLDTTGLSYPIVVDPAWSSIGALADPLQNHSATMLASGKVLVAGGFVTTGGTPKSEEYDFGTGVWTRTGTALDASSNPYSVSNGALYGLADGTALLIGGSQSTSQYSTYKYDPTKAIGSRWSAGPNLVTPRSGQATVWAPALGTKGSIFVIGGSAVAGGASLSGVEIYDVATAAFSATGDMTTTRRFPVAGIVTGNKLVVSSAGVTSLEVWSPTTGAFTTSSATLSASRAFAFGIGGRVLFAGGASTVSEWFDPATASVTASGALADVHGGGVAITLPSGAPMIYGGAYAGPVPERTSEIFDPALGTWAASSPLVEAHEGGVAVSFTDATGAHVLAIGGKDDVTGAGAGTKTVEEWTAGANGVACKGAPECSSGFCVDGHCCESACTGACRSCGSLASPGKCVSIDGDTDPRGICPAFAASTAPCGLVANCVAGACAVAPSTQKCGAVAASCTGFNLNPGSHCSGTDTSCVGGTAAPCAGSLVCADATSCKTSCSADADCVGVPCDLTTHTCHAVADAGVDAASDADAAASDAAADAPTDAVTDSAPSPDVAPDAPSVDAALGTTIAGAAHTCKTAADCSTGFCVDSVCCDAPCTEPCHSCALPSSPGKCTAEPPGVDLRSECGAAGSCIATCGVGGACVGSGAGTLCARSVCTDASHGKGGAYCSGAGATCAKDAAPVFDCAPYGCDSVFGACRTVCVTTADCAPGAACDSASQHCVAGAATTSAGGCSTSAPASRGAGGVAVLFLGVLARRRRRGRNARF